MGGDVGHFFVFLGLPSDGEGGGLRRAASVGLRNLEDADRQRAAQRQQRAPIGDLLGGGVEGARRAGCQRAFNSDAVADLNRVGFAVC